MPVVNTTQKISFKIFMNNDNENNIGKYDKN